MSLINIEYGALASSETLNKNYTYLNEKITNSVDSLNTSISSLLSNIASINVKLNDLSDEINETAEDFLSKITNLKNKVQISVNSASILPNWNGCFAIDDLSNYVAEYNGFLLLNPEADMVENIEINDFIFSISSFVFIPIKAGDIVKSSANWQDIKFLPTSRVVIND